MRWLLLDPSRLVAVWQALDVLLHLLGLPHGH